MRKTFTLFLVSLFIFSIHAQIPAGYYDAAVGKKQAELKTSLHLIIKNATPPSYGSGASSTWGAFTKTDIRPEDGTVWDMYSNNHIAFNGTSAASGMNIEHSLANSWWGGTKNQTYNDLFNLNPSNSTANSAKGSWPIAVVDGTTTYSNGVIKVGKSSSRPGGEISAWEPADEYKGDFARSYMYMVTSYEDFSAKWTGNSTNQLDNNTYPVFEQWTVDLFLKWCAQDPVSQKEIDRNNEVYKIQNNRNPFIDYPELAEYIWGNKIATAWTLNNTTEPSLASPISGATIDFGTVTYQQNSQKNISVLGSNLTDVLTLRLSGTDASYFSIAVSTISKENAQAGYNLIITYNAPMIGTHNAVLTISGGGIADVAVNLTATAVDCQNLNFTAPFSSVMSPFTEYSISGDQKWAWTSANYGVTVTGYAGSTNNANEDWLLSPSLNLSTYKDVVLAFEHTINKGTVSNMQTENTLWVSNDYNSGNPNAATWTQLIIPTYPAGNNWTFVSSGNISIPADKCKANTFIGFKYLSTTSASSTWEIKNLSLTGACQTSEIRDVENNYKHKIYSENKNIYIQNIENEDVVVCDIYGKIIYSQKNTSGKIVINSLNSGIFVIKIGNEVQKTIVR